MEIFQHKNSGNNQTYSQAESNQSVDHTEFLTWYGRNSVVEARG